MAFSCAEDGACDSAANVPEVTDPMSPIEIEVDAALWELLDVICRVHFAGRGRFDEAPAP